MRKFGEHQESQKNNIKRREETFMDRTNKALNAESEYRRTKKNK